MNKIEKKKLLEIYEDCLKLEKQGTLTEFGEGQLILCKMLLNHKNKAKQNE